MLRGPGTGTRHAWGLAGMRRTRLTLMAAAVLTATAIAGPAPAWQHPAKQQASSQAIPIAVFGNDDRVPTPAKYKDVQEKIGLFFNLRRRTVCTAFCVAPDVIV